MNSVGGKGGGVEIHPGVSCTGRQDTSSETGVEEERVLKEIKK